MSLDGYVTVPKQSVTQPLAERSDELRKWAFAVRGFRALHGMEGGTTGPDDNVAAESLQNIGVTFTPLPRNSSISASGNVMFGGKIDAHQQARHKPSDRCHV
jgi:hypothetical protein